MFKVYIYALSLILFYGCSTKTPPVVEYKLSLKNLSPKIDTSSVCKDKSLKVANAFGSTSFMSLDMKYTIGKTKIYSYSQAQWDDSLNREITSEVVQFLRKAHIFKTVQNAKSRAKGDFVLELNIEDFMQYYDKNIKSSYVRVVINMTLIEAKTNVVKASKTFEKSLKTTSLDAEGGVDALNEALKEVLQNSLTLFDGVCK
jgi:cholesterol transport system auxiliary component